MFQASSAHLQEDIVVYTQHMVLSHSITVPGGLSVHSWLRTAYRQATRNSYREWRYHYVTCTSIQLCPPEDEHLMLETCRGEQYFVNK